MSNKYLWISDNPPMEEIYDLLYRMGVIADNAAFFYTSYAILLVLQEPDRLGLITKWLYPDIAKHYDTTSAAIEHGIRRTISDIWQNSPAPLSDLAGTPLPTKPSARQFLSILSTYLQNQLPT